MSDALLSPAVGVGMLGVSAAALALSSVKMRKETIGGEKKLSIDETKIPVMGVMGAFVFAAQMINFTIPGTGSSGHLSGGILLAAVLGPYAGLITLSCVLLVQCLFFADGGLLAYGCNVFNMAAASCFIAFPLIYKPIVKKGISKKTLSIAAVLSAVAALQIGAFGVVLETQASGVVELPFAFFAALMQPIHLAIGIIEGVVTAAVLCFIYSARPELLINAAGLQDGIKAPVKMGKLVIILALAALAISGGLSIFASSKPDGLEWSIEKTAGTSELERDGAAHNAAGRLVEKTAFLPDYALKNGEGGAAETALAGIAGSVIMIAAAGGIGLLINRRRAVLQKKTVNADSNG